MVMSGRSADVPGWSALTRDGPVLGKDGKVNKRSACAPMRQPHCHVIGAQTSRLEGRGRQRNQKELVKPETHDENA